MNKNFFSSESTFVNLAQWFEFAENIGEATGALQAEVLSLKEAAATRTVDSAKVKCSVVCVHIQTYD